MNKKLAIKETSKLISQYKGMKRKSSTTATNPCNEKKQKVLKNETPSTDINHVGLFLAACIQNDYEIVDKMLALNVDVNATLQAFGTETALMMACAQGHEKIVRRLCQVKDLDINYQEEKYGWTAAHLASTRGQTECVRILAETGRVDWNKANKGGQTPLYWALREGHSDIVDIIVKQPNIDYNVKTEDGETLGHASIYGVDVKCVETLAAQERFDSWNVPDRYGDNPVMMALKDGEKEIVEILLRCSRVDLDVVDVNKKHLEEINETLEETEIDELPEEEREEQRELNRNRTYILDLLWTFRSVQQRMILRDSLLTRQAGVSSLQSLSRDAVLLILSTNNSQERLVTPLVDRLEGEITPQAREQLLASYSERD